MPRFTFTLQNFLPNWVKKERAEREWQRAFEAFQALVKKEPKNWKWHIYMSEALSGLGKEKEADALLEETAKRFRKQWQVWMAVGINRWIRPMRNFVSKMESVAEDALQTLKGEGTTDLEIWGAKILGLIEAYQKRFSGRITVLGKSPQVST